MVLRSLRQRVPQRRHQRRERRILQKKNNGRERDLKVDKLMGARASRKGIYVYEVKWYETKEPTWEPMAHLVNNVADMAAVEEWSLTLNKW